MSNLQLMGVMLGAMLVLIALRVPIGAAMFVAGAAGYWGVVGELPTLAYLKRLLWARFASYDLSVIPMFLLMGQFASTAGFSRSLFRAAKALIGHRNGGLSMAAIIACAAFGAVCGSSVATAATMSQVALPEMKRLQYSDRLSTGTLAVGGTLGILIPPSVILIIYAVLAEQSIAKLFAAAIVPGILATLGYIVVVAVFVRLVPGHAMIHAPASREETLVAVGEAWPILLIFTVMLVGIYGGFFTPAEGAAVGTVATWLLGLGRRQLNRKATVRSLLPTARATGMIFTVLLGATMMNSALAVSQIPAELANWIQTLTVHPLVIIAGFLLSFVMITCVLDELAMMLLLLPILLPVVAGLDLFGLSAEHKMIWFGILMLNVVQVGLVMPPIGLNVYVIANIAKTTPLTEIYNGIIPFLVSDFLRILLLLLVPALSLSVVYLIR